MIPIDWTLNVGHIIQILAVVGGGAWMFLTLRSDVNILKISISNLEKAQDSLNQAFKQLGIILTQVAVQDNRLNMVEKNLDELRHGQGFIGHKD